MKLSYKEKNKKHKGDDMQNKLIIANWKMNLPNGGADGFAENFLPPIRKKLVVAPPHPFLSQIANLGFTVAGQDVSANERGAFTGDVSAELLSKNSVKYCIVGHSERRQHHHETHELLSQKIIELLNYHITPIFCVGEHHADYIAEKTNDILSAQLSALNSFKGRDIIIAYEPVWAIGTGLHAKSDYIKATHHYLKERVGKTTQILYGGSVNGNNAAAILSLAEVDGLLIGSASLKGEELAKILAMAG